jgi:hypothetical protein
MHKVALVLAGLACLSYVYGRQATLLSSQGSRSLKAVSTLQTLLLSMSPTLRPHAVPHASINRAPVGSMFTSGDANTATLVRPRYRKPLHEFEPQVQEAVIAVTKDLKNILHAEPNWDCFTKDAILRDPTGTVISLHTFRQLFRAMRKFQNKWVAKQSVSVETRMIDNTVDPEMLTEGTINFDGMGLPIPTPFGVFSLKIDGTCIAHLNKEGKITDMIIEHWRFNGKRIQLPVLRHGSLSEDLSFEDKATLLSWAAQAIAPF